MSTEEQPYAVEYAKSGRAGCQICKEKIDKDVLRLAVKIQSPIYDGVMHRWHHLKCFFTKQRPKSTADIEHFDKIRWEDQQEIAKKLEEASKLPVPTGKGRKRGANAGKGAGGDFHVEYSKSSRATCIGCQEKIIKNEIRVSKKDYESDDARRYGCLDRWYHLECFAKLRAELQYFESGSALPGIKDLSKEDQGKVKSDLPKIKEENVPPTAKKMKAEPVDAEEEKEMKEQNAKMFNLRDNLSKLSKPELISLLNKNNQEIPVGPSAMLDSLIDVMSFGALKPCTKCHGQLQYASGVGYKCTGNLTEWTKCENIVQDPERTKFSIPKDLKEEHPFLKKYKSKVGKRLFKITAPSTSSAVKKEEAEQSGPKVQGKPRPLKNMQFFILGRTKKSKDVLKREIELLGGKVVSKIHPHLAAIITTPEVVEKSSTRLTEAKTYDIQVVAEDFVEEAAKSDPIMLIKNTSLCGWGSDPKTRIINTVEAPKSYGKSRFEKSASGKVKLRVKGGGAVDPESGLEDTSHVYQEGKVKFTIALGLTDIQSNKNSYYKMQILKHDKENKYWFFRNWGRIGTTIGGTKLENLSLEECIEKFEHYYRDKTGNHWMNRDHFQKVPGKLYPIDLDYGLNDENTSELFTSDIESKLKPPVQNLIRLLFDVDSMKRVMMEFEIDMDKMPLGKLSEKQIQEAYSVLSELLELVKSGNAERMNLVDATNRFYTLIPHDFGLQSPPILNTEEEIQVKSSMLDSLLEIEIAYNMLHAKTDSSKNPLDAHYEQLKAEIDVLEKTSEEYKVIEQYVKNTHAATHSSYQLEIEDVFAVKRQGEEKRYKPFKKLPNRKLLWHGSRTTNFAGILSQGLRIAPPEAPVTGYMFGKGIYFADMVSKSANYCCTNRSNPTGLLMLCEVALGNMYERYQSDYIEKLPKGKHSTKGIGQTQPDPKQVYKTSDGVEVPYGPAVPAEISQRSALLYNEYIVYDVAQVNTKYLIRANFKYNV